MTRDLKHWLIPIVGISLPVIALLLIAGQVIPYTWALPLTCLSILIFSVNGISGLRYGRKNQWKVWQLVLFGLVNLLPMLFFCWLLFPMYFVSMMM